MNPDSGTLVIFRSAHDAAIARSVYMRFEVLGSHDHPFAFRQMLNQSNSSALFMNRAELDRKGFYRVENNQWACGADRAVPVYEGKMVRAFDHRAADIVINLDNARRQAQPAPLGPIDKADPARFPHSREHIRVTDLPEGLHRRWLLAFKDITATTNDRTMIAAIIPECGAVHTLPILVPADGRLQDYIALTPLLLACFNSFSLDYFARQKVQGTHLSWYIIEQLPVLPLASYARAFGPRSAAEIVREDVLALSYTAHDLAPFARDMGYEGPPYPWNEDDRRRRRARLDALHFLLYGLTREDAAYILTTFPIVEREDIANHGRYLTRDLILAWMAALEAGDPDADIHARC